jgi:hypothetical protein
MRWRARCGCAGPNHPKKGVMQFDYSSFQANDDPVLKLVIYTPA